MADCANTESSSETAFRMKVTQGSCQNGGTFNSEERCDCTAGFAGDWCQRPLLDCKEGMALGYPQGLYNIQPTLAPQPFQVYCWMVFGRTYINRRFYTSLSFYRTWQEYRLDGFGDPAGDHWIGLENLYHLTNSGIQYQLMVQLELENGTFYQQYYFFNIGDEADLTYDADNDGDVMENCAERHQSGWWFPEGDCSLTKCNPHGVLVQSPAALWSGKPEDVFWLEDLGDLAIWKLKMWLHR
nr:hypothetical protein BaRGS_005991 [Batillaria attramentaria]